MRKVAFGILSVVRLLLGVLVLVSLTATFLDFTGTVAGWVPWLRKVQFMPAVLSCSVAALAFLLVITLLFGRVYCSVLCPLGVFQDLVRLFTFGRLRDRRFRAKACGPALYAVQGWTRVGILLVFVGAGLLGLHFAWLDPYGIYARFVSFWLTPMVEASSNAQAIADCADLNGTYFTRLVEVVVPASGFVTVSVGIVAFIAALAAWRGRVWCNTVCPVGTVLGAISRFAWLRPTIDENACVSCRMCERVCRAHCIHIDVKTIDTSKCVSCLDCSAVCPKGAIKWKR